jgi:hypothetical protein
VQSAVTATPFPDATAEGQQTRAGSGLTLRLPVTFSLALGNGPHQYAPDSHIALLPLRVFAVGQSRSRGGHVVVIGHGGYLLAMSVTAPT